MDCAPRCRAGCQWPAARREDAVQRGLDGHAYMPAGHGMQFYRNPNLASQGSARLDVVQHMSMERRGVRMRCSADSTAAFYRAGHAREAGERLPMQPRRHALAHPAARACTGCSQPELNSQQQPSM